MSTTNKFPYRILVEYSAEDEVYVARVPALLACAAHGDTAEEAIREVQIAGNGSIEVLGSKAPPSDLSEKFSGKLNLRIPESIHGALSRKATIEGVSLNQLMVSILSQAVGLPARVVTHEARGAEAVFNSERGTFEIRPVVEEGFYNTKGPAPLAIQETVRTYGAGKQSTAEALATMVPEGLSRAALAGHAAGVAAKRKAEKR